MGRCIGGPKDRWISGPMDRLTEGSMDRRTDWPMAEGRRCRPGRQKYIASPAAMLMRDRRPAE
ncbi:hypothetical protein L3476_26550 [Paenibacillus thiaminolyticus]|uniref:hypothetical protein n=1 Tax=Paenibacillus thiaminolyticus TaxID=49283 RepID=UPI001161EBBE|nr:hypothetical protein [Paenibacillus thiaminolyticus]NGP58214.1 hypothetical protein [Paenibacillus thiaminolyticus]WCR26724.1 hypothetical protein L3476_26550 [Paenibacillus thiaminolyticus]